MLLTKKYVPASPCIKHIQKYHNYLKATNTIVAGCSLLLLLLNFNDNYCSLVYLRVKNSNFHGDLFWVL